jgi:hypothetical protein
MMVTVMKSAITSLASLMAVIVFKPVTVHEYGLETGSVIWSVIR